MNKCAIFFTVFGALAGQQAQAQMWCPQGATWCLGFDHEQSNGYSIFTYAGDTIIGGQVQQAFTGESHYYTQNPPGYHDNYESGPMYTRFSDSVLYSFNSSLGIWDTLIWYSAAPGDQWQVFQPEDFICDCRYTVTDTGHTVVDGIPLRYVQTSITGDACEPGTRRLIERIGSVEGIFVMVECATGMQDYALRHYQDFQMNYSPPGAPPCDLIDGIAEFTTQPRFNIFPNPGTAQVTLQVPHRVTVAEFMDRTGRICLKAELRSGNATIDVSTLAPGLYIVRLRGDNGTSNTLFVKQ